MDKVWKRRLLYLAMFLVIGFMGFRLWRVQKTPPVAHAPLSQLTEALRSCRGQSVMVTPEDDELMLYEVRSPHRSVARYIIPNAVSASLLEKIERCHMRVQVKLRDPRVNWLHLVVKELPTLFLVGLLIYYLLKIGRVVSGKEDMSKFELEEAPATRFTDVGGVDTIVADLQEIVAFLCDPTQVVRLGGTPPKGSLLVGPPGTGKTLLARAVAGEAGVPFFSVSGSDFCNKWYGVGGERVRALFELAKKRAPCIVFIDEIDAVGLSRGDEKVVDRQTLNQLLVEMDGFDGRIGVVVLAATNREEDLDSALRRPGRFDRTIHVSLPDLKGRCDILKKIAARRKMLLASDVDLTVVARSTPGVSGAVLESVLNESVLGAIRRKAHEVEMYDVEEAMEKLLMGRERPFILSKVERGIAAVHEAGHALIAVLVDEYNPIHKATILPRGVALGRMVRLPTKDLLLMTRRMLIVEMMVCLGGRLAEIKAFGPDGVTSGASDDLRKVAELARRMVCEWGFSARDSKTDLVKIVVKAEGDDDGMSEELTKETENSMRALIEEARQEAEHLFEKHEKAWRALADALTARETLTAEEIRVIIQNVEPPSEDLKKMG